MADSIHAIPIFAYLPHGNEISDLAILTSGEDYLFNMCQTNDRVTCFSARPHFSEKRTKGVTFKKRVHWGPVAHLAAAEAIMHYLDDGRYAALRDNFKKSDIVKPNKRVNLTP